MPRPEVSQLIAQTWKMQSQCSLAGGSRSRVIAVRLAQLPSAPWWVDDSTGPFASVSPGVCLCFAKDKNSVERPPTNRSLTTIEPVCDTAKRKLKNAEQRLVSETHLPKPELSEIPDQRLELVCLARGNV